MISRPSKKNYPNKSWIFTASEISRSGTLDGVTAVITGLSSTSDLREGFVVSGTGIPADSVIVSVDGSSQITIDNNTTSSGAQTLTFDCQFKVPSGVDTVCVSLCGGGKGGASEPGNHGANGGSSSFGTYITATGGNYTYGDSTNYSKGFCVQNNGASNDNSCINYMCGSDAYYRVPITVTPGESIDVTIGIGGNGGTGGYSGQDGADGILIVEWVG